MRDHKSPSTLSDVAKHANVSIMTVSRVVNGDARVRQATRDKVNASIKQLKYAPNIAARALARGAVQRVCLLYDNPSEAYLGAVLLGALEASRATGANLIVQQADSDMPVKALEDQFAKEWDALIIPPPISENSNLRNLVARLQIPATFLSSQLKPDYGYSISIDDERAAYELTTYLIERGHHRIGFINGPPNQSASGLRYQGYIDALRQAGLKPNSNWIAQGAFTVQSGLEAGKTILQRTDRPSAIFAANDDMAAGVMAAASMCDLTVPDDLSVVGFDDSPIALTTWPNLTTIRQPLREIAKRAVNTVLQDLQPKIAHSNGQTSLNVEITPHELIRRGSVTSLYAET